MNYFFEEGFWIFLIGMFSYDGHVYGLQFDRNEILELDKDGRGMYPIGSIPVTLEDNGLKMFHRVVVNGEKAYFIPFMQNEVCIYDFRTKNYSCISIEIDDKKRCKGQGLFYEGIVYGEYLVLLPFTYREILFINLKTKEQTSIDIENEFSKETDIFLFRTYIYLNDHTVVVPSLSSNKVLELNLETKTYRMKQVGNAEYKYGAAITYEGKHYLLIKNYLGLLELNEELQTKDTHLMDAIDWDKKERQTFFEPESFVSYGKALYCFPAKWNHAIKIDMETKKASYIESMEVYCSAEGIEKDISIFDGCVKIGKYLYLQYQLDKVLRFDLETEEIKEYPRRIYDPEMNRLNRFLGMVLETRNNTSDIENTNIGKKVFEEIKRDCERK